MQAKKPFYQVTYIGSCNEDWNCEIIPSAISGFSRIISLPNPKRKHKGEIKILKDTVLEIHDAASPSDASFLSLRRGQRFKFDKNTMSYKVNSSIAGRRFPLGGSLRRPGGGATNCAYNTSSVYTSMGLENVVDLVVLEASDFCRKIIKDELKTRSGKPSLRVLPVRKYGNSFSNINISADIHGHGSLEKLDFTMAEGDFKDDDAKSLEKILRASSSPGRMFVVNSVKDEKYSKTLFDYISKHRRGNKFVLAATGSMLSKNYAQTLEMAAKSDIYVSNIEEFYDLFGTVKGKDKKSNRTVVLRKATLKSWEKLKWGDLLKEVERDKVKVHIPNERFVEGLRYLQKMQRDNGKQGRVYITCGEYGAVVADEKGDIYFQATHPKAVDDARYPNGAGDAFVGVMVALESLNHTKPAERTLTMAVAGSQIAVRTRGANAPDILTDKAIGREAAYCRGSVYKYDPSSSRFVMTRP